jgi:hypothetical protein
MQKFSEFRPTRYDSHITVEGKEDWLVLPCTRNRDSECLDESNFHTALQELGGEGDDVEIHRFSHWGPGWFELILIRSGTEAEKIALQIESKLENYPILNEDDLGEREQIAANETWKNCYSDQERVAYIRSHSDQFQFHSFSYMLRCVRGSFFAGYASELLSR